MNEITLNHASMTSLEIVDLINSEREHRSRATGKSFKHVRHDNAKRVIDSCVSSEVITFPQIEETSFTGSDGRRQTASVYRLDKRSAIIVTAQLSPEFTAAIVDRLEELESNLLRNANAELFLTHPIYKDLEAHALDRVTKFMDQMIRIHLVPYLRNKHTDIVPSKLDALLSDMKRFMFTYFPDHQGKLQYLPRARRKAQPSRFVTLGDTEIQAEEQYRMKHKHITNPLETLEEYKARACDRPASGIAPVKVQEALK